LVLKKDVGDKETTTFFCRGLLASRQRQLGVGTRRGIGEGKRIQAQTRQLFEKRSRGMLGVLGGGVFGKKRKSRI